MFRDKGAARLLHNMVTRSVSEDSDRAGRWLRSVRSITRVAKRTLVVRIVLTRWVSKGVTLLAVFVTCAGCRQDMADQPHFEPLEVSDFFADGRASRPLVPDTVARGHLRIDKAFFEGKENGKPIETYPRQKVAERLRLSGDNEQVMAQILGRGRQRFDIFCAACHDRTGSGQGMVVQRGFPTPPSYHSDRLREAPVGHFYDVITHGFGRMPDYAGQIPPADRWAIVAYVRALQLSQHADVGELSASDREALQSRGATP